VSARGPTDRHRARKRFGQHFLERVWVDKVVAAIAPARDDTFLEIGSGNGALTRPLAACARRIVAIEIDRDLGARLMSEGVPNVHVHIGDVLDVDLGTLGLDRPVRVAGNLPYNISSPILFHLLRVQETTNLFTDATLMLQREVADRLVAAPGTREYGLLSVFVALGARVTRLLNLPPGAFRPAPAVTSAVVRLDFLAPAGRPRVPPRFEALVRALFTVRRKTVLNGLRGFVGRDGRSAAEILAAAGIDGSRRPETLGVGELLALAEACPLQTQH
jgi:16S rRNA (adenine1518-N6/adenine1519-N6)-dimethyltransferase